ncbi:MULTISPECIES: superoxide dismutase [Sphingomonas]|uniref:Superoxide dismutase n=1 Tax=Sphingomonas carotinifaciens TaxID=1166323 RepID=A0A1G7IM89_9SPHN|nr:MULTISPECIES: superoxide dismutase [Sphingomonas]MBB4084826.1 Fe-Mn family superoxide dismutase [Sphingomonas carotinifaciens]MWC44213.1 superoxide dismutase [Sphingomonas carotinifaciens]SDF13419.1 superoxide dismutase, Fe-Mn family [Sphingomonas carotinifaciens]
MAFELPPLPYDYDALEPVISKETMTFHHDKHHKAYTDKLNEGVEKDASLQGKSIEDILGQISSQPPLVRNNGGGYWNHDFFWKILSKPGTGGQPSEKLQAAIDAYGGLDKLKEDFNTKGAGQFGSGWAWVIVDGSGALKVTSTPNQDNPLMDDVADKGTPILGNDVWEHAYYLTYKNDRAAYLKAWWDVVNWNEVSKRFEAAGA